MDELETRNNWKLDSTTSFGGVKRETIDFFPSIFPMHPLTQEGYAPLALVKYTIYHSSQLHLEDERRKKIGVGV